MKCIHFYVVIMLIGAGMLAGCLPSQPPEDSGQEPETAPVATPSETPGSQEGADVAASATAESQPVAPLDQGTTDSTPTLSQEELTQRFMDLIASAEESMDFRQAGMLALQLAQYGDEAYTPILDALASPDTSPKAKIVITTAIGGVVNDSMAPRLIEMTDAEYDATTRACATHLLGGFRSEDVAATLWKLAEDEEHRVRVAALLGLAGQGNGAARDELVDLYREGTLTVEEKSVVVRVLALYPQPEDADIFADALSEAEIGDRVHQIAVQSLGRIGNPESIAALEAFAQRDGIDEDLKSSALGAVEVIKERHPEESPLTQ